MPGDQSINSELEFKKADLKIKKWDVIIKCVSALLVSITILFTYAQYRNNIEKDNDQRNQRLKDEEAQKVKDRQTALRESLKPFLEKQMQLYVEASSVTAKLATLTAGTPREEARKRFWQLYWGELSLVESREVESAMVQFGNTLEKYERQEADITALQNKSYQLAHACRESLSKIGEYDLPSLGQNK